MAPPRCTLRGRIDNAECFEKGVGDVDHHQEEGRGCQQRECYRPETTCRTAAIHGRGFHHRCRNTLQAGQEEDEIDTDLFPDRNQNNHETGIKRIKLVIEIPADRVEEFVKIANDRVEHQIAHQPGHRWRDGIGPHQCRLVSACAAQDLIGFNGQEKRYGKRQKRYQHRKNHREPGGLQPGSA